MTTEGGIPPNTTTPDQALDPGLGPQTADAARPNVDLTERAAVAADDARSKGVEEDGNPFSFSIAREPEVLDLKAIEDRLAQREPVAVNAIHEGASASSQASQPATPAEWGAETVAPVVPTSIQRPEGDRPASVTRTAVGPAIGATNGLIDDGPEPDTAAGTEAQGSLGTADDQAGGAAASGGSGVAEEAFWDDRNGGRSVRETPLLIAAVALAILSGILGALWLRERSNAEELRSAAALIEEQDLTVEVEELEDQNNTLRLQNDQLQQQLTEMSALVLELPAGRVTEIDVPLTPIFADEENGRLIAMNDVGEYVVWGDGVERPITDSGTVGAVPTGLFAATAKAWVSTDAGQIDIVAMTLDAQPQDSVVYGPAMFLAADERGYWTYNSELGQVVRLRKSDGGQTAAADVPVGVVDLAIGAGSVWALGEDGRVYRINTVDFTVQAIEAGEDLISITAGPDALWTLSAADGSLRRIDPVTGAVLVTVPVGRDPIDATFAGSSVWVALRVGSSLIEVDTRTSAVVSRTELSSEPAALYEGESGVFVTTVGEDAPLLRIDSLVDEAADEAGAGDDAEAETVEESDGS